MIFVPYYTFKYLMMVGGIRTHSILPKHCSLKNERLGKRVLKIPGYWIYSPSYRRSTFVCILHFSLHRKKFPCNYCELIIHANSLSDVYNFKIKPFSVAHFGSKNIFFEFFEIFFIALIFFTIF